MRLCRVQGELESPKDKDGYDEQRSVPIGMSSDYRVRGWILSPVSNVLTRAYTERKGSQSKNML